MKNRFKKSIIKLLPDFIFKRAKRLSRNRSLQKVNTRYQDIFVDLENTLNEKRIILIGTAVYGNIGDHAISIAEVQFLKDNFPDYIIFEIPISIYETDFKRINKLIKIEDLILINGGGFLGTLWEYGQEVADKIIINNPKNNIIIMPQTMYYKNNSDNLLIKHQQIINNHPNLSIILRDKKSYNFVKDSDFKFKNILFTPDIVTYSQYNSLKNQQGKITFILRRDQEKISVDEELLTIKAYFKTKGYSDSDFVYTDSVVEGNYDFNDREEIVTNFLKEVGESDFVISDRLHGMLMTAICGIPVLALDNISRKVYGAYEWFENHEHVLYYKEKNLKNKMDRILERKESYSYDPDYFNSYHSKIKELIESELLKEDEKVTE